MADDDEGGLNFGFGAIPVPAELIAHFMEHRQQAEMRAEERLHSILRMFEEMDLEYLRLMKFLLAESQGEAHNSGFWEGLMLAVLARRSDVCMACGKNHDEEAARLAVEEFGRRHRGVDE